MSFQDKDNKEEDAYRCCFTQNDNMFDYIVLPSVEPDLQRATHSCHNDVCADVCAFVRASFPPSVRICSDQNFCNYGWISK